MKGPIPPEAVIPAERLGAAARAANQIKWVSRINTTSKVLGVAGLALGAAHIGLSAHESIQTGDPKPVVKATAEVGVGFATAYAFGKGGLLIGAANGGPIGAAAGALSRWSDWWIRGLESW